MDKWDFHKRQPQKVFNNTIFVISIFQCTMGIWAAMSQQTTKYWRWLEVRWVPNNKTKNEFLLQYWQNKIFLNSRIIAEMLIFVAAHYHCTFPLCNVQCVLPSGQDKVDE